MFKVNNILQEPCWDQFTGELYCMAVGMCTVAEMQGIQLCFSDIGYDSFKKFLNIPVIICLMTLLCHCLCEMGISFDEMAVSLDCCII